MEKHLNLVYVIRDGWREAFESTLPCFDLVDGDYEYKKYFNNARFATSKKDAVFTVKGSFGTFELFDDNSQSVLRIADASTKFAHLASKVELAKWSRAREEKRHKSRVCPVSGWLRWDSEFDHPTEIPQKQIGAEFLSSLSLKTPWVMKRDGASGGTGIVFVTSLPEVIREVDLAREMEEALPFMDERRKSIAHWAIQRHIDNPMLLLGGYKFHLRAFIISIGGNHTFLYKTYEVRIAPKKWKLDFTFDGAHITNGGGAEANHERRFLIDEFEELKSVNEKLKAFLKDVVTDTPSEEKMFEEIDNSWLPVQVMGMDIMVDEDENLFILESNHSPASPPFDNLERFGRHVRRFAKNLVNLLLYVGVKVKQDPLCKFSEEELYGFTRLDG
jgi:hypothetical protein